MLRHSGKTGSGHPSRFFFVPSHDNIKHRGTLKSALINSDPIMSQQSFREPAFDDILTARGRIAPYARPTPLLENAILNDRVGGRVLLKAECLQTVGAFKFRGALNKISQVDRAAYPGGVVALSSGNHAQGTAEAARILGFKARIVMPSDAPAMKVARTRRSGAEVISYDRDKEDREAIARDLCARHQAALVHPFDDPDIIAGQGTAGLELMEEARERGCLPDAVLAPVSGGGLVTGVALAARTLYPPCQVWSVEPVGFDDFARSLAAGAHVRNDRTSGSICDALMAVSPGQITFALAQRLLAGGLAVTDDEVRAAMRFAYQELKLVVEPGGAAALAAVLTGKVETKRRVVAVILSGGNVDPADFARIITSDAAI
jgi:threonine dehydratase